MSNAKRLKKREEQRKRQAILTLSMKKSEAERQYRENTVESGRKAFYEDDECNEHSKVLEILSELTATSVDFISKRILKLGIINKEIIEYSDKLTALTAKQVHRQDKLFKDKSEKNFAEFAERSDFIYDCIILLANIPDEKRIQTTSTLKILSKK